VRAGKHNAKVMREAAVIAERQFKPHPQEAQQYQDLAPMQVSTRPELFQPREFSFGARAVNVHSVKKLASRIRIIGELD
jgi:hypothetical protein